MRANNRVKSPNSTSFHNCPKSGAVYEPSTSVCYRSTKNGDTSLPRARWPTGTLPQVIGGGSATLRAFIRGYLFRIDLRACAESLASENASRLAAMQRADKNIDELLEDAQSHISSSAPEWHRRGAVRRCFRLRSADAERIKMKISSQDFRCGPETRSNSRTGRRL